jgi:nucleoside-diphosphate-sugar epimerase
MRILVTGASGFIGGVTCAQALARGHEVVALVRRPGSEPPGTAPALADLRDGEAVRRGIAASGPDCVLHLAAVTAETRDDAEVEEVDLRGTERVVAACESARVRRLVFTSTVVTGDAQGRLLTEDEPLPVQTAYGRAKQAAERAVLASSVDGVVVRPGHVYGPGGWYAHEIVPRVKQPGRFAVVGRGDNLWDMVHVEDVAAALLDAAERAQPGRVFHCADDTPITYYDFVALTAAALGRGRPRRIPAGLARLAAGANAVAAVTRSARTSNARLKAELGWSPRYPTAREGVPAAIAALPA